MNHLIIAREYPPAPYAAGGIGTYVEHIARLLARSGERAGWARMAGRRAPGWSVVFAETAGAMIGPICFGIESWRTRSES